MRKQLICLVLILLAVVSEGTFIGGWTKIKDLSNPEYVEIAKFAIAEYKKQSKVDLVYKKIIKGKTALPAGKLYDLTFSANNSHGGATKNYEAVVWVKPWEKFRSLRSFKTV